MSNQNFIALDLELNQPSGKIIQVGVCAGGRMQTEDEYRIKSWYLDPGETIAPEIVALTGIDDQLIAQHAQPYDQVAAELSAFIMENNCFVNPVTWGGGDSPELLAEFRQRDIQFHHFGRRWIDVKTVYSFLQLAKGVNPAGGLSSAMGRMKMQFKGSAHRAEVDAFNTLRLWFGLMERQTIFDSMLIMARGAR